MPAAVVFHLVLDKADQFGALGIIEAVVESADRVDDARGARVATGGYFCRMTAPGFSQTRKMVLRK